VRFEVATAIIIKIHVFKHVRLRSLLHVYRRFGGTSVNFYFTSCPHIAEEGYLRYYLTCLLRHRKRQQNRIITIQKANYMPRLSPICVPLFQGLYRFNFRPLMHHNFFWWAYLFSPHTKLPTSSGHVMPLRTLHILPTEGKPKHLVWSPTGPCPLYRLTTERKWLEVYISVSPWGRDFSNYLCNK
jgi:hypothetical protein